MQHSHVRTPMYTHTNAAQLCSAVAGRLHGELPRELGIGGTDSNPPLQTPSSRLDRLDHAKRPTVPCVRTVVRGPEGVHISDVRPGSRSTPGTTTADTTSIYFFYAGLFPTQLSTTVALP